MIVSVDKASEAADWLEQLTFDVGQKPYQCVPLPSPSLPLALLTPSPSKRRLKHSHVALLGTSEDKVQSGKDLQDTYIKLLASLPKVTEPVAKGIVAEYPTLRELYEAWEACEGERERREMLVGIGVRRLVPSPSLALRALTQPLAHSSRRAATSMGRRRTAPSARTCRRPCTAS